MTTAKSMRYAAALRAAETPICYAIMPRLAAFPKAWLDDLCVTGTMSLREWIEIGASLHIDGLEFYSGFLDLQKSPDATAVYRRMAEDRDLALPMFCCSPDFTHPDADFRQ